MTCEDTGCERPAYRRGYCSMHYQRRRKLGAMAPKARPALVELILARTEPMGKCLVYTGRPNTSGYGQVKRDGMTHTVHRVVYEALVGPIPEGYHLDHVYARGCRHRRCVLIEHLEPVTPEENYARIRRANALKESCPACGSQYSLDRYGGRFCSPCKSEGQRQRRVKERVSAGTAG